MANSLPFDSVLVDGKYDRAYKAEDWAWYFATFIGNGIFPKPSDGLQVTAYNKMEIKVNIGYAFINGYAFRNPVRTSVTLEMADGALNRIDRLVVRWDKALRDTYLDVLKGVPSAKPTAAAVTRNTEIWELAIADIYVGKGVTRIQTKDITDQRFNSAVCGIVAGTIKEIDASVITKQFNDFFDTYSKNVVEDYGTYKQGMEEYLHALETSGTGQLTEIINTMTNYETTAEKQWVEWFDGIREVLESTGSGEMLAEILMLIKELYDVATTDDIDKIIGDKYVDAEESTSIFETGTNQDIDDIIGGIYQESEEGEEKEETAEITEEDVNNIVSKAFKGGL